MKKAPSPSHKSPLESKIPSYFSSSSPTEKHTTGTNKDTVQEPCPIAEQPTCTTSTDTDSESLRNIADSHTCTQVNTHQDKKKVESSEVIQHEETKQKTTGLRQLLLSPKPESKSQKRTKTKTKTKR